MQKPLLDNLPKVIILLAALGLATLSCTPSQYAQQADKTAYNAIGAAEKQVFQKQQKFSVGYDPITYSTTQPTAIQFGNKLIPTTTGPAATIILDEALEISYRNSRPLQDQKESLYSSALAVTNGRRGWNFPLFSGEIDAAAAFIGEQGEGNTSFGAASVNPTLTQKLHHGGLLTLGFLLDTATDFNYWNATSILSALQLGYTQPLLRGALEDATYEPQYRRERNFVFDVYSYERFTQTFAVDIVTRYLAVLTLRDQLQNEAAKSRPRWPRS